jgi:hypothetical protein
MTLKKSANLTLLDAIMAIIMGEDAESTYIDINRREGDLETQSFLDLFYPVLSSASAAMFFLLLGLYLGMRIVQKDEDSGGD